MRVFVISQWGRPLMPCRERKARILVRDKKAAVVDRHPYTIRLLYPTGGAVQETTVGIDTGSQHIGTAVTANGACVYKADTALRSTMERRSLLEARKTYRRGRRFRKVRYRHPKFRAHTIRRYVENPVKQNGHLTHWKKEVRKYDSNREEGWLPPSVASKTAHHIRWIGKLQSILPDPKLVIEVARFDAARMKDPAVHNEQYQHGAMYDFENVKAYLLERDNYRCKCCGAKIGAVRTDGTKVRARVHHIDFRSKGATDNPERMAIVCDACHTAREHRPGGRLYEWMEKDRKFARRYRDAALMNIMRKRLYQAFPSAKMTYGNITAADRKALGLPKSHANDAIAIAAGRDRVIDISGPTLVYRQVRRKKRSLHEATARKGRKEPNRTQKRNSKNTKRSGRFWLWDAVKTEDGAIGWIKGFTGKYNAYVVDRNGEYLCMPGKTHKQYSLSKLALMHHTNSNWIQYTT